VETHKEKTVPMWLVVVLKIVDVVKDSGSRETASSKTRAPHPHPPQEQHQSDGFMFLPPPPAPGTKIAGIPRITFSVSYFLTDRPKWDETVD
jgi:hypothetical protein